MIIHEKSEVGETGKGHTGSIKDADNTRCLQTRRWVYGGLSRRYSFLKLGVGDEVSLIYLRFNLKNTFFNGLKKVWTPIGYWSPRIIFISLYTQCSSLCLKHSFHFHLPHQGLASSEELPLSLSLAQPDFLLTTSFPGPSFSFPLQQSLSCPAFYLT